MERFTDLSIVLHAFRYAERDLVVHMLTENHGKVTAMAKNAVHSRRFGGSLQNLAASTVTWVQKPHSEMARIDEAVIRNEFKNLPLDYERMSMAALLVEFCAKVLENGVPQRDIFLSLSNALFHLDAGAPILSVANAFFAKALRHWHQLSRDCFSISPHCSRHCASRGRTVLAALPCGSGWQLAPRPGRPRGST